MVMKKYNPTSPARRFAMSQDFGEITKATPEKGLVRSKKRISGRNCHGRVTMRWRGGGHKRKYRIIDFRRNKLNIPGVVTAIEYDPNRSARIALITYKDGEKRYILSAQGLKVGATVVSGAQAEVKPGNALALSDIPVGEFIHNVELRPGRGGVLARGAGVSAQLMAKIGNYALMRLPSGEQRRVLLTCMATVGALGNSEHANREIGKAGVNRWLGRMPNVRGVAMNPIDHPHGGGEGKTSGGRHPVTPWGKPTKGFKTRNNKATDKYIVRRRTK